MVTIGSERVNLKLCMRCIGLLAGAEESELLRGSVSAPGHIIVLCSWTKILHSLSKQEFKIHGLRTLCLCLKAVTIINLQKCYWDVMIPLPPEIRTGPLDKMESVQMQSSSSYKCTEGKISKRNICAIQIA